MQANGIATMASGELQNTRFQLLDTADALGLISEFADGEPLVPDRSEPEAGSRKPEAVSRKP